MTSAKAGTGNDWGVVGNSAKRYLCLATGLGLQNGEASEGWGLKTVVSFLYLIGRQMEKFDEMAHGERDGKQKCSWRVIVVALVGKGKTLGWGGQGA